MLRVHDALQYGIVGVPFSQTHTESNHVDLVFRYTTVEILSKLYLPMREMRCHILMGI